MVHLFKEHELKSVPESDLVLTLTSSGTGGTKVPSVFKSGESG